MEVVFAICATLLFLAVTMGFVLGLAAAFIVYYKLSPDEFPNLYKFLNSWAFHENGFISMGWVGIISLLFSGYVYFAGSAEDSSTMFCMWSLVVCFFFLTFMTLVEWLLRDRLVATRSVWSKP